MVCVGHRKLPKNLVLGKGLWRELLPSQGHGAMARQADLLTFRGEDTQLAFLEGRVRSSCVGSQPVTARPAF